MIPNKNPSSLNEQANISEEEQMALSMEQQYTIVDFCGVGTVLGEMGTLLNTTRNASVECETDVQVSTIAPNVAHSVFAGILCSWR